MTTTRKKQETGISIIVPVFNEEGVVRDEAERILNVMQKLDGPSELIIVDDGSTDGSAQRLDELRERLQLVSHTVNCGYGAALKTGIQRARYPLVAIVDADGEMPVEDLPKLVAGMATADMVVGARTGSQVHVPMVRRPAKRFLTYLANYMSDTPIPDLNSGFRVFRKKIAQRYFHILPNRFSFTTTITLAMLADGYTVSFESINCYKREGGKSKIRATDAVSFFILILRTTTYFNPLRIFAPITLTLLIMAGISLCFDVFWEHNIADLTTLLWVISLQVLMIGVVADLIVKRGMRE